MVTVKRSKCSVRHLNFQKRILSVYHIYLLNLVPNQILPSNRTITERMHRSDARNFQFKLERYSPGRFAEKLLPTRAEKSNGTRHERAAHSPRCAHRVTQCPSAARQLIGAHRASARMHITLSCSSAAHKRCTVVTKENPRTPCDPFEYCNGKQACKFLAIALYRFAC